MKILSTRANRFDWLALKSDAKILLLLSLQALSSSRLTNVTLSHCFGSEVVAEEFSEYTEFKDDALQKKK